MANSLLLTGLSNQNTIFLVEPKEPYEQIPFRNDPSINLRSIQFSHKGEYLAIRTDKKVEIIRCNNWSIVTSVEGNIKEMAFSPLDTYLIVFELFCITQKEPQGKPNMRIYKIATGELVGSFVRKTQLEWEPQWSSDEALCALQIRDRVIIYKDCQFDKDFSSFLVDKLKAFSLSPSAAPNYYFSVFNTGKPGQPSFWRIYNYPDFNQNKPVVSKSTFQADKITFKWNRRGTNLLALTQTDVDKTGGSYYGKQSLFFGDVKGNSGNVVFSKEGPIHATAWSPGSWNEWIAVYGYAPAKATVFNAKCEPLFEFGTGSWNSIYFSPDGAYVLLGGFGNIATGHIEVWALRGYKKVGQCTAPDTTYLEWDPRGETFITATTYPRLCVGNGYKIWHYTGVLMHNYLCKIKEMLLHVAWLPGNYAKTELSRTAPKGIQESTPKPTGAYRPPSARNRPSTFTFHEHEAPHKPGETPSAGPSKQAIKQKEKREARKARKAEEKASEEAVDEAPPPSNRAPFVSTGDPEKDKKIKNINKKLSDIDKLKHMKASGKQLELNQQAKIDNEPALLKELEQLRL